MGFRNVNSLPTQKSNSKNNQLIQDIRNAQLDCLGVAEVNLAWQNLPFHDQLKERFKGSLEFAHYTTANNQDPSFQGKKQSGGTMLITNGESCARVCGSEHDFRKLGRWCSVLLRGKAGLKVRVVSVYRPVQSLCRAIVRLSTTKM